MLSAVPAQPSIGLFYATIGGRTYNLVKTIEQSLQPYPIVTHNLADADWGLLLTYSLMIWISPTYGKGDMHYLWQKWSEEVSRFDLNRATIFPIVLGDRRHHPKTYGGAWEKMIKLAVSCNADIIIPTTEINLPSRMVLDFVSNRKQAELDLLQWVDFVKLTLASGINQ